MKTSFLKVFFVIMLSSLLLVNCNKSNDIIAESYMTKKEWIHANGGIYKNETISMTSNDGSVNIGTLNWSSVDTFNIGQTKYTEIPFYFPNLSVRKNSNKVFVENVSFSLVIRTVNGITEAAVKITQRNVKVKNANTEKLGSIEYYSNLEGEQLNIWFIDDTGKKMTMRKQNQYKIANYSTTAKTSLSDAVNDCITFNVPMYDYQCWVTGGEYNETACGWKLTAGTNYLFCWTDSNGDNGSTNLWPPSENRGEGGEYNPPENTTPKIVNFVIDECLANIVNRIIDANLANKMSTEMLAIFGESETMNLNFYERDNNIDGSPGNHNVILSKNGIKNYNIYIDLTKMPSATQEYIASVVIHEITHAIIKSNLPTLNGNTTHHYEMLKTYITNMKDFLQQTYKLEDDEALSMILIGIGDLSNYLNKVPVSKEWSDAFEEIATKYKFSLIMGDSNNVAKQNNDYFDGNKGTKRCQF